ncbi:MAG: phosphate acyltransferase PlsX [Clostridia bacterium]|nr:phosphate acyltransferase PlsX [Clostridia bacterium]
MRIVVDVMSGDNSPSELIRGVCAAAKETEGVEYTLVGDEAKIRAEAEANGLDISSFCIVHAEQVITMEDDPICVTRAKANSSMSVGLKLLANGEGDAFVSAGNTGALFTGASLIVRRAAGVRRAAIAALLPMDPPVLLLDSGANISVTPEYLEQFAVMGSAYMKKIHGIDSPRVGLLNNGAEAVKGTELQKEAYKILGESGLINFVGNVEANMITRDTCDVLVTDGFTGNILLKTVEGVGKMMLGVMKNLFYVNLKTKIAGLFVKSHANAIKKKYDPKEHGGAPILGIAKPVIKAHGSSDARAFKNAIKQAIFCAENRVTDEISGDMTALLEFRKEKKKMAKTEDTEVDA